MSGKFQRQEFIRRQTEAFKDYAKKEGAKDFEFWAESKGLLSEDVNAIYIQILFSLPENKNKRKYLGVVTEDVEKVVYEFKL